MHSVMLVLCWLLLPASLEVCNGYSSDNGCEPLRAKVTEMYITISCPLQCKSSDAVSWFNEKNDALPDKTTVLMLLRNNSVQAVGGKCYKCQCESKLSPVNVSRWYQIWVDPNVTVSASKMAVKLESSVSITCTADGYPPPNNLSYFQLYDPANDLINYTALSLNGTGTTYTVTYYISSVSGLDGGEYDCTVILNLMETLQGSSKLNMTVYAPPVISKIRNLTPVLFESGLSTAVLECVVNSTEPNLEVWVNWTRGSGSIHQLEEGSYTTGIIFLKYFYIFLNISESHMYTCNLFSAYSSQYPEDHKTLKVTAAGKPRTPILSPTNPTRGLSPNDGEDINLFIIGTVGGAFIVGIIVGIGICMTFYYLKKFRSRNADHSQTSGNAQIGIQMSNSPAQQNPDEVAVNGHNDSQPNINVPLGSSQASGNDTYTVYSDNEKDAVVHKKDLPTQPQSIGEKPRKRKHKPKAHSAPVPAAHSAPVPPVVQRK